MAYKKQAERIYPEELFAKNPEVELPKKWEFLKVETLLRRHPQWSKDKVPRISDSQSMVAFILDVLSELEVADRERAYVVFLDQHNGVNGIYELSVGTTTEGLVGPKEMFRAAVLSNTTGLILVHNHPSGNVTPSVADKDVFKRLVLSGKLLGVRVLDSIIIGAKGAYFAFSEHGLA